VTKAELIDQIAEKLLVKKKDVTPIVEEVFASIEGALAKGEKLPEKNKDHSLIGDFIGHRECHIAPDWLLVYKITEKGLILLLTDTGTHSDLFG